MEMFEEKQLLASCIALREDITKHKSEIIALENRIHVLQPQGDDVNREGNPARNERDGSDDDVELYRVECLMEEKRKAELLEQIIKQKEACCLLRAKLEMNLVRQPKLLVTRF